MRSCEAASSTPRAAPWALCVLVCLALAPAAARAHGEHPLLPPRLLAEPQLVYPEDALREGVGGDVVMEIELDATGAVQRVLVTAAPDARLAWAALGAVTNLPFEPARHVGEDGVEHPTAVRFTYTLTFAIDEDVRRALSGESVELAGLHGRVVDTEGRAVAGAHVVVDGMGLDADTDGLGAFDISGVPNESVTLLVEAPGYASVRVVAAPLDIDHEHDDVIVRLTPLAPVADETHETRVGARRGDSAKHTLTQDVAVLDAEQLSRTRGRTLAGTLTEIPGVSAVQAGPVLAKPVVRGSFGRRLVMLVDGVRHEGQDWGVDHAPEIDPHAAGRIEVVKGAAGVRYGPDAVGGVILLEPRPMRLNPGADGEVSLVGVDNGLRGTVGTRVDLVFPELPSLSLRLEGNASKGAALSTPTYVLGNTASEVTNVGATALWRTSLLGQETSLKLSYRRFEAKIGVCYCLNINTPEDLARTVLAERPLNADIWTTSYEIDRPRQEVVHDLALARGTMALGGIGRLTATYAFQNDARAEFDQVRRAVQGPQFQFTLVTHSADVTFEHAALHLGRFTLGGQAGVRGDMQQHAYSGLQLIPNYRRFVGGVWALERLTIADVGALGDLELVAGARADQLLQTSFLSEAAHQTQVRRGRIDDEDCTLTGDVARCEKNLPALSLTAGARMHIDVGAWSDALVLQADVSSATRFPDVDELYLGGRAPSFPVFGLGDAGLGTERTLQLSLGGAMTFPFVVLEGGAFASRIDDYIAFGPETGADGNPVVDVLITGAYPRFSSQAVDAMLSGFDGGVVLAPGSLLSLMAQVAVVRGLDLTNGGYLPFMPPPQARIELRSHVPDATTPLPPLPLHDTTLSLGVVLVARQERSDRGTDFVPPPDGYMLWNAAASTEVEVFDVPLRVGVEIRNLTNQRYREALSLTRFFADEVGREIWLRLEARFDDPLSSPG